MKDPLTGPTWEIVSEVTAFVAPPYLSVRRQHIITDRGRDVPDFWQIDLPAFAIAVALTEGNEVLTLWQYKHGARRFGLSFPAGHIEAEETPEAAILRELKEETGYEATTTLCLGQFVANANQGCGTGHLFLLTGCRQVCEPDNGDIESVEVKLLSIPKVETAIKEGMMVALPHLAVWGAARLALAR